LPYRSEDLLLPLHLASEAECNAHYHSGGKYQTHISVENDVITVIVSDNGKGIDNIDKALEKRFSTANETAKSHGVGSGFGMWNMKVADILDIKTEKGIGTVITMMFIMPPKK
jgi:stage II sporulation protein AB (anti-sigma F factor)